MKVKKIKKQEDLFKSFFMENGKVVDDEVFSKRHWLKNKMEKVDLLVLRIRLFLYCHSYVKAVDRSQKRLRILHDNKICYVSIDMEVFKKFGDCLPLYIDWALYSPESDLKYRLPWVAICVHYSMKNINYFAKLTEKERRILFFYNLLTKEL